MLPDFAPDKKHRKSSVSVVKRKTTGKGYFTVKNVKQNRLMFVSNFEVRGKRKNVHKKSKSPLKICFNKL